MRTRKLTVVQVPLVTAVLLLASQIALAGKYNETLSIGDAAPAWSELPAAADDAKHSLVDLKDAEVVVVVFTCNTCPTAVAYEDPLIALAKRYGDVDKEDSAQAAESGSKKPRVVFVAINVNKVKEDLLPAMKNRAEKKEFPYPYLYDESQQIAKRFGAVFTPEFFVLDRDRKVVYMGAMDAKEGAEIATSYVAAAIDAALVGKTPEVTETPARGCRIRFVRERRK
ncbi:MAG: thioredoxin family protein [Planctomycetota bacterium]|nr:thioredoxin family protein [Planctomycetota bacterium]